MRAFLLAILCFLIAGLSYAQSQVPPPSNRLKSQPLQQDYTASKKPTAEDQRGTEKMPFVIKGIPAEKTPDQAKEDRNEREIKAANERGLTLYTGWLALFTLGLIFVGSIQVGLFIWQLRLIRESLADTKIAADAALKTAESMNASERAYIKMSHAPPGLISPDDPLSLPRVHMEVKNIGKTPARITAVILWRIILRDGEQLPTIPPYPAPERVDELFLYKDDPFYFPKWFTVDSDEFDAIQSGDKIFYVYGYVDYVDQFGKRHRAGYARRFKPMDSPTDDNLIFVTQEGYNYDRPRNQNEGRDWDQA